MNNTAAMDNLSGAISLGTANEEIAELNQQLEKMTPIARVEWSMANLPSNHIVSSSFGAQSAVMLHLLNDVAPGIPVVLTDTGYLFPETYQFIDELNDKLNLNLHVYSAAISPAWQEARHGKLWEQGIEGIEKYNQLNKVNPMQEALVDQSAKTWFAGLRRTQSSSRNALKVLKKQTEQFKV
jgi:phosphoadenosine phosphosulfate reductase